MTFGVRSQARGVTLVEVLIVVALIGLLAGAVVFGSGMLSSSRVRGAATLIAAAVRAGIARANTTGRPTRLVLDLETDKVSLEEATGSRMLREKSKPAGAPRSRPSSSRRPRRKASASSKGRRLRVLRSSKSP